MTFLSINRKQFLRIFVTEHVLMIGMSYVGVYLPKTTHDCYFTSAKTHIVLAIDRKECSRLKFPIQQFLSNYKPKTVLKV